MKSHSMFLAKETRNSSRDENTWTWSDCIVLLQKLTLTLTLSLLLVSR